MVVIRFDSSLDLFFRRIRTTTITTEPGYFVQIQENSICIFRPGCTVPLQKLDTPVNTLTEYDRNHLENGITIDSDEALRDFIEDYIS